MHHISLSLSFAFFQKVPFFPAPFPTSSHFLLYFPPIFGPFPPIFLPISPHILVSRGRGRILAVSTLKLNDIILPVRAAIPVKKIVVSIGHFPQNSCLQSLSLFYLFGLIKSNSMYSLQWNLEKNWTEPNELDQLKYSKSLTQMTSYAH